MVFTDGAAMDVPMTTRRQGWVVFDLGGLVGGESWGQKSVFVRMAGED